MGIRLEAAKICRSGSRKTFQAPERKELLQVPPRKNHRLSASRFTTWSDVPYYFFGSSRNGLPDRNNSRRVWRAGLSAADASSTARVCHLTAFSKSPASA